MAVYPHVRRRARERALEFLFGLDFTGNDWTEAIEAFWAISPTKKGAKQYANELVSGVMTHRADLDTALQDAVDNWSLERVGYIERNILRIALYEMRYAEDVPTSVAINEAIEVAKVYGPETAPQFINGVLDKLKESASSPRNDS